jgi:hypothetical protein
MGARITQDVVLESGRGLHKPAWNSSSLQQEQAIDRIGKELPVFAFIKTSNAIYSRAKIIHENREELRVSYAIINRKGGMETKTDIVPKWQIRTLRVYSN